jgi:HK97 gp10 family phage protein
MAKTEILGIGELKASFAQLKSGMESRIARSMVVAAGGVIKRKAKANMQAQGLVRTGSMLRNVAIKREPSANSGTAQYHLGVRHGRSKTRKQKAAGSKLAIAKTGRIVRHYADDPYYWRFAEFGTTRQLATPSLGPALEQGRTEAIDAMAARLQKELDKAGQP